MPHFFAINILTARKAMGLSQTEAATRLGLKRTTYAGYETDQAEPDLETLMAIADFYGFSVDDLLRKNPQEGNLIDIPRNPEKGNLIGNPIGNLIDEKADNARLEEKPSSSARNYYHLTYDAPIFGDMLAQMKQDHDLLNKMAENTSTSATETNKRLDMLVRYFKAYLEIQKKNESDLPKDE